MPADALFDLAELTGAPVEVFTVHCFFNCGRTTQASDPTTSGARMEQHYAEQHRADINRALGFIGATPAP